ncbi:MAG: hypothetical protein IJ678_00615 [Kiritimatiellae bacterium]|nr:hypothetical protein [Kiritimatiellia bacterium]
MKSLKAIAMAGVSLAALASWAATDITVTLTTSYVKVADAAGPITGLSLAGITAFGGSEQVEFTCVSNRPYAAVANSPASGELPAGDYVHQLSVFNCWDGTQTRSYRVQIAQPVGSTDIYAYCPCFTVSQPGVNLVDHPDIRDLRTDTSKIAASYTASTGLAAQLSANPVTALKLSAVPYVESDGTSGIDTGYRVKPNTRLEVDFALTEATQLNQARVFGADYDNSDLKLACSLYVSGTYLVPGVGNETNWKPLWMQYSSTSAYLTCDTNRHSMIFDFLGGTHYFTTDGTVVSTKVDPLAKQYANESTASITLFARKNKSGEYEDSTKARPAKARIYGVKIYEDDALVHDFVPCTRDGIAAFRDAVTGDFIYGEKAPLAFTAGGDFENYESPYVATPSDNSAIYIDTGYQASSNTCVALDCALMGTWENGMSAWSLFLGWGTKKFWGFVSSAGFGVQTLDGNSGYTTGVVPLADLGVGLRRTYVLDNFNKKAYSLVGGVTNGVKTAIQSTESSPSSTITVKIGSNHSGTSNFAPMKIFGCKIYEEGVLVRDFVPCAIGPAQDGSAIVGLRDAITGAFATYPAATSANRLTCGGEGFPASAPYVETLRSANRYIDTGYSVTANTKVALDYAPSEERTSGDTWYLFAAKGTHNFAAYINNRGFGFINSASWKMDIGASVGASVVDVRRTVILDNPANLGSIVTEGVTSATCETAVGGPFAGSTLKISAPQDGKTHFASIRIYGCKIWEKENGEYVLKRDYVPAVEDGKAGLRDILPGGVFKPGATATTPITYGGVFTPTVTPAAETVKHGETATLTASAPGAASYRWLKNGAAVSGGADGTLAATYGGAGVVDSYQATAVYAIDAAIAESEPSAPATVEGVPSATVLIIR